MIKLALPLVSVVVGKFILQLDILLIVYLFFLIHLVNFFS